jgi:hypothetical protein
MTVLAVAVALFVGLVTIGLVVCVRLLIWRGAIGRAEKQLSAKVDEVMAEFPQECKLWGGRAALKDPVFVREALRELEAPVKRGRG